MASSQSHECLICTWKWVQAPCYLESMVITNYSHHAFGLRVTIFIVHQGCDSGMLFQSWVRLNPCRL
jgi:hypothetical protein